MITSLQCRWYVATGSLQQPLADLDKLASSAKTAAKPATPDRKPDSNPDSESEDHESASADAAWQTYVQNEQSTRHLQMHSEHCVIFMRGVVWRSDQVQVMNLWQNLLKFWPVPFASDLVKPKGRLQAHGGVNMSFMKHVCAYIVRRH